MPNLKVCAYIRFPSQFGTRPKLNQKDEVLQEKFPYEESP